MKLEFRLSREHNDNSGESGTQFHARNFLRELSDQVSDNAIQNELRALSGESDPELLGSSLVAFARRQESRGNSELATAIYQNMAGQSASYGLAESRVAQQRLDVLRGGGTFGERVELFTRNFLRDVTDPATLVGMAVAGGVFQALRTFSYARLLANPAANLLTRGMGARGLSFGLAFLAEAPAFSFGARATSALLGRQQDWSSNALQHELGSTYLMIGALRLSGVASQGLYRRLNPQGGGLLSQTLFQQSSMFAGITAATWAEQQLGWRERTSGGALLASSLASLIHFNAVGRVLHGLGGGEWTQRLRLQQERMDNFPPPRPETGLACNIPTRLEPALATGDRTYMSSIDGTPSTPPPPMASEASSGRSRSSRPPPRDVRADLTEIEQVLGHLFDNLPHDNSWVEETSRMGRTYTLALESLRANEERVTEHPAILSYIRDLSVESDIFNQLLSQAKGMDDPHFSGDQILAQKTIEHFYRSANVMMNFMNNESTLPESLMFFRTARYWVQHGVEKSLGEAAAPEHRPDFPYVRGEDGYYRIKEDSPLRIVPEGEDPRLHVIVLGDDRGPRTFELVNDGHRVSHVNMDVSNLRVTQRLMDIKVTRAKDSGEWRATRPDGAGFHGNIQDAKPADFVELHFPEAYLPDVFNKLKPRSDPRRYEQLHDFITNNLTLKLKPNGIGFVMSSQHDFIEDLAKTLDQFPHLERLEFQLIRDRMPIRAGEKVLSSPGDHIVSWLIFKNHAEP